MDIKMLKKSLPALLKARVTPLIIGHKGVGKSAAVKQFAQENGYEFIDLRLGQMSDAGDIMGLPQIKDGMTQFMKPDFFPTKGKGILFLDEVNRTTKDILQAVFQLVYDRRINSYQLPSDWHVVAAMNPATEEYDVLDFSDFAFADRFCQIKLIPNFNDYIDYLKSKNTDSVLVDFLRTNPTLLKKELTDFKLAVSSGERSWDRVGDILAAAPDLNKEALLELIGGLVGSEAAISFINHKDNYKMEIDSKEVFNNYAKVRPKVLEIVKADTLRADVLNKLNEDLVEMVTTDPVEEDQKANFVNYLQDLPVDITIAVFQMVVSRFKESKDVKTTPSIGSYTPLTELVKSIRKQQNVKSLG